VSPSIEVESMEASKPEPPLPLAEKLMRLFQAGAIGSVVLASATVDVSPTRPATDSGARLSIEERVDHLRQQPAEQGFDAATGKPEDALAWYNWHNWRNGWPNGWHNWHNWHNWW